MTLATTQKYEEMVLEIETSTPGTYAKICGMTDVTISRTANVEETQVPDCDDESIPHSTLVDVSSLSVSVSATGVWAQSSQSILKEWFYSGATKNIRLRDTKAAVGDVETEAGPAILTSLNNERSKGPRVSAEIELRFSGTPTRTDKAS